MDIGGLDIGDGPVGGEEQDGGIMGGKSAKTVGVLVGFLALFFVTLVVLSYV